VVEPQWVQMAAVRLIHARQLAEHGGSDGVRDEGMLESAMGRPRNAFAYGDPQPDLQSLTAAYAFDISRNHPFVDGNKRTAFVVCRLFLLLNGLDITAPKEDRYVRMLGLAEGSLTGKEFAEWLRENAIPFSD